MLAINTNFNNTEDNIYFDKSASIFQNLSFKTEARTLKSDKYSSQPLTPKLESWGTNPFPRISPQVTMDEPDWSCRRSIMLFIQR